MKILHIISGMNLAAGGPPKSIYNLVIGLLKQGVKTSVLTLRQKRNNEQISDEAFISKIGKPIRNSLAYSRYLNKEIKKNKDVDIIHAHGLWQYPTHIAINFAFMNHIPCVISPRGMLSPEALEKSRIIKLLSLLLYQYRDLRKVNLVHATSNQEKEHIRKMGIVLPIAVLPNPILIENDIINNSLLIKPKNRIGFIGRLDPIKNIESLLKAWGIVNKNSHDWELVIIGDGPEKYKKKLHRLGKDIGLKNIIWCGYLTGEKKEEMFSTFKYLILPSFSENFGMVVAESLVRKIPVVASKGTPWEELNLFNAGWWIDNDEVSIANTLRQALTLEDDTRKTMGENGRNLIEKKYSSKIITSQMIDMYKWILQGGNKPEFIYTD